MGFPQPGEDELKEMHRSEAEAQTKIAVLKAELDRLKAQTKWTTLPTFMLPRPFDNWLQRTLQPKHVTQRIQRAQDDHDWAVYERTCRRRPLYPRPRELSRPREGAFYSSQSLSPLFSHLIPELRWMVYLQLLGGLTIEIEASHGGHGGPKGSEGRFVHFASRITRASVLSTSLQDQVWQGGSWDRSKNDFTPSILPVLQSCRRVYNEAIDILYSANVFQNRRNYQLPCLTKYLLKQRLEGIRLFRCRLEIGYPWHVMHIPLEALALMRGLKSLRIDGEADGMVDGEDTDTIDPMKWRERKGHILSPLRQLQYIEEVDVYLPILDSSLGLDARVGSIRVHGLNGAELSTISSESARGSA